MTLGHEEVRPLLPHGLLCNSNQLWIVSLLRSIASIVWTFAYYFQTHCG